MICFLDMQNENPYCEETREIRGKNDISFPVKKKKPVLQDPWEDWKPDWHKGKKSPHLLQEKHSPTESVSVRLTSERKAQKSQRRIVDARLWEAMNDEQQKAALEIALAFETMGRGLGYVSSDWQRIPGCRGPSNAGEAHGRLIRTYVEWTKACHKEKISHSMIIDILAFGFTCRALDRDCRLKSGTARQNLFDGLTLYCVLKGWIKNK